MSKMNQYKIGDRVVYHAGERSGNRELDGWVGTVIGTDTSRMPYTVEFDEPYAGAMDDERFGGKKGHCWHCAAEHLSAADVSVPGESSVGNRRRQAGWSPEELQRLKAMKEAGRTARQIGQVLGRTEHAVAFQWTMIKKREKEGEGEKMVKEVGGRSICNANTDASVPTGKKVEKECGASRESPPTEEMAEGAREPEAGQMGELETALSEVIRELKGENDALRGENAELRQVCAEQLERIGQLTEETLRLTERSEALRAELTDTAGALGVTESQLDELRRELTGVRGTLKHTQKRLEQQEETYREDTELLYQREVRIKTLEQLITDKDERIERLEERLSRATRVALGVTEKLLLGGEGA